MALIVVAAMSSCENEQQRLLREYVDAINSSCPVPLGVLGEMEAASYHHNTVEFNYIVDDKLDLGKYRDDEFYRFMLSSYEQNTDESFCRLFDAIINAEAEVLVTLAHRNANNSHSQFSIRFETDSLKAHRPRLGNPDPEAFVRMSLNSSRMQIPMDLNNGMVWSKVELDDRFFTYVYDCDETRCNIANIQAGTNENHQAMVEMMLSSGDVSFSQFIDNLYATGRGLRYIYVGNLTGLTAELVITNQELKQK